MRSIMSRWFLFGLLVGWAMTHATVFAQPAGKAPTAAEKLRANLDKNVTIDFTGQSLQDVLNHFKDKTGIAINIDPVVQMQTGIDFPMGFPPGGIGGIPPMQPNITLKAKDEKASQVLRKLLNNQQLTYVLFEDAVLVTTDEMALYRQMRQRVSVDVEDVPFNKAVRTLAKNHGINLVLDPKLGAQADAKVSLQLESTGLETAMRLLAEMASLKAVRMGNVMFVTTPEKAEKIRKEEAQQLDNPFNPNLPIGGPPVMRGGFGGGIGGIALPGQVVPAIPNVVPPPPGDVPIAPDAPPRPKQAPRGESAPGAPPLPQPAPDVRPALPPAPATTRPRE